MDTITDLHRQYPIFPGILQAIGIFFVLLIVIEDFSYHTKYFTQTNTFQLEVILTTALFTPLILVFGMFFTVFLPITFGVIRIMLARDQVLVLMFSSQNGRWFILILLANSKCIFIFKGC